MPKQSVTTEQDRHAFALPPPMIPSTPHPIEQSVTIYDDAIVEPVVSHFNTPDLDLLRRHGVVCVVRGIDVFVLFRRCCTYPL